MKKTRQAVDVCDRAHSRSCGYGIIFEYVSAGTFDTFIQVGNASVQYCHRNQIQGRTCLSNRWEILTLKWWPCKLITIITFDLYKLVENRKIGSGCPRLPHHVSNHKASVNLDSHYPVIDNLCLFCNLSLSLARMCTVYKCMYVYSSRMCIIELYERFQSFQQERVVRGDDQVASDGIASSHNF